MMTLYFLLIRLTNRILSLQYRWKMCVDYEEDYVKKSDQVRFHLVTFQFWSTLKLFSRPPNIYSPQEDMNLEFLNAVIEIDFCSYDKG